MKRETKHEQYYLTGADGKEHEVSEEIFRAYKHSEWNEKAQYKRERSVIKATNVLDKLLLQQKDLIEKVFFQDMLILKITYANEAAETENPYSIDNAIKLYEETINLAYKKGPMATGGFIDTSTEKTYLRQSGPNDIPNEWDPIVGERIVQVSLEALEKGIYNNLTRRPSLMERQMISNCAEVKALNDALMDGAKIEGLMGISIRTRKFSYLPLCNNCQKISKGIPFVNELFPMLQDIYKK